MIQGS
jgi:hypothetical protein